MERELLFLTLHGRCLRSVFACTVFTDRIENTVLKTMFGLKKEEVT